MREFKYRVWNEQEMIYNNIDVINHIKSMIEIGSDNVIMQFTGLKDKYKKDIYEGDIVKDEKIGISIVVFLNSSFCVKNDESQHFIIGEKRSKEMEVVGNIFELEEW